MAIVPRACITLLAAGLVLHSADPGRAQALMPTPIDLLDRYDRGDGERAAALLETLPDDRLEAFGKAVQKAAPAWLHSADPVVARRRRLAAATLTLDLAHVGLRTQWTVLSPLIEWGCSLVRQNPAGQSEHDWHLASVALAGAARDSAFLIDPPISRGRDRVFKHLNHASDQFQGDPRWRLAGAMALEFPGMSEGVRDDGGSTAWPAAAATASIPANVAGSFRMPADPERALRLRRSASSRVLEAFRDLLDVPGISAEAHLHLGHRLFVLRQLDEAFGHYQQAARLSDDSHVRYLANFLAGRLFDILRLPADAERHYQRALNTVPNAQSAAIAVAAARFVQGVPHEAYAIVESAFSSNPRPPDPWRLFFQGDYRFWPRLIQRLHTEVR